MRNLVSPKAFFSHLSDDLSRVTECQSRDAISVTFISRFFAREPRDRKPETRAPSRRRYDEKAMQILTFRNLASENLDFVPFGLVCLIGCPSACPSVYPCLCSSANLCRYIIFQICSDHRKNSNPLSSYYGPCLSIRACVFLSVCLSVCLRVCASVCVSVFSTWQCQRVCCDARIRRQGRHLGVVFAGCLITILPRVAFTDSSSRNSISSLNIVRG